MISTQGNNLSKEKIQQLLAAVGRGPAEDTAQVEVTELNWHEPHYFNKEQLKKLGEFAEKAAAATAKKLTASARSNFSVTITSVTQHYAGELTGKFTESNKNGYYLPFGSDPNRPRGLVGISGEAAIILAMQLLGDLESEKAKDRRLSQLEESLLLDTGFVVVEAISTSSAKHDFRPAKTFVQEGQPLEIENYEELCKIVLAVKKENSANIAEVWLLITCGELELAAGIAAQTTGKTTAENLSKIILEHIRAAPVPVTVRLASTAISLKEVMNLQPGDILLLDKKIDEPVELVVGGRTVCRGQPAKSAGEYAMAVTEPLYNSAQKQAGRGLQ
ncbi:MAG: FliM/FliN family flagellar motor switch protein [Sedimentisphaerales bacterium]|nr:FliM/FliN family flagellar motor switch protein [Sedimentisphaerales bacterium]